MIIALAGVGYEGFESFYRKPFEHKNDIILMLSQKCREI